MPASQNTCEWLPGLCGQENWEFLLCSGAETANDCMLQQTVNDRGKRCKSKLEHSRRTITVSKKLFVMVTETVKKNWKEIIGKLMRKSIRWSLAGFAFQSTSIFFYNHTLGYKNDSIFFSFFFLIAMLIAGGGGEDDPKAFLQSRLFWFMIYSLRSPMGILICHIKTISRKVTGVHLITVITCWRLLRQ